MAPARSYGLPWHLLYPFTVSTLPLPPRSLRLILKPHLLHTVVNADSDPSLLQRLLNILRIGQQSDEADQVW